MEGELWKTAMRNCILYWAYYFLREICFAGLFN